MHYWYWNVIMEQLGSYKEPDTQSGGIFWCAKGPPINYRWGGGGGALSFSRAEGGTQQVLG